MAKRRTKVATDLVKIPVGFYFLYEMEVVIWPDRKRLLKALETCGDFDKTTYAFCHCKSAKTVYDSNLIATLHFSRDTKPMPHEYITHECYHALNHLVRMTRIRPWRPDMEEIMAETLEDIVRNVFAALKGRGISIQL